MINAPDFPFDLRREFVLSEFQIISRLKIHPVTRAGLHSLAIIDDNFHVNVVTADAVRSAPFSLEPLEAVSSK